MQTQVTFFIFLLLSTYATASYTEKLNRCSNYIASLEGYSCVNDVPFGSGGRGTTFLIESHNEKFILKVQEDDFGEEKEILQALKGSDFVVQLIDVKHVGSKILIIESFGENGTLDEYLTESKNSLTLSDKFFLFEKIMRGVHNIHKAGYVHADLKTANIVIDKLGNPMIIDFDLAVKMNGWSSPRGTLAFMAPEIILAFEKHRAIQYTPEVDLYALGVIFYDMITRTYPYYLFFVSYFSILHESIKFKGGETPKLLYDFSMMSIMPLSARKSFSEALEFIQFADKKDEQLLYDSHEYSLDDYTSEDEKYVEMNNELSNFVLGIVILFAFVFFWSFVIYAVCYCACKKKKPEEFQFVQNINNAHHFPMTAPMPQ